MAALLDRGCDSNVLDLTGRTALQLAAGGGFTNMVALLLQVKFYKIKNLNLLWGGKLLLELSSMSPQRKWPTMIFF